jgi:hypothetical protein
VNCGPFRDHEQAGDVAGGDLASSDDHFLSYLCPCGSELVISDAAEVDDRERACPARCLDKIFYDTCSLVELRKPDIIYMPVARGTVL